MCFFCCLWKFTTSPFTELTGEALEQWEAKKAKIKENKLKTEKTKQDKKAAKMTKADYLKQAQDERFVTF